jgi:two-component system chemotaxis response regulator CheB
MSSIRVLVIDDSVVVRRLVTEVLSEDPGIDVIGTASNGKLGVEKVDLLRPDLVTLDIEMPEMNGLEALREIRKRHPRLPVVMFSTLTHAGASATLDALAAGASDYVTKPSNVGSITEGMQAIRDELIPKVKALCRRPNFGRPADAPSPTGTPLRATIAAQVAARTAGAQPATSAPKPIPVTPTSFSPVRSSMASRPSSPEAALSIALPRPSSRSGRVDLVMIGSSTGGPNALATLWADLPRDLGAPVIITQHMPPMFTTLFAERLTKIGTVPVFEGVDGMSVKPGHAYLAPGDHHMVLEGGPANPRLRITKDAPVNSCRPAVDPMFKSAVRIYAGNVLAVILTGMGSDGLDGCRTARAAGGHVVAQDEQTSVVWGMPGHVAQAGLADAVIPLERVAAEIAQRVGPNRFLISSIPRRPG